MQPETNPFSEGLPDRRPIEPCIIVLFGATGDLTRRKLIPAFYHLAREGNLPAKMAIVGFARRDKSDDDFRRDLAEGIRQYSRRFTPGDALLERPISFHSKTMAPGNRG